MNAEILAVGTELLLGDILNTNARFLSRELAGLGIDVFRQSVVGDNPRRLLDAFQEAFTRTDMLITTGGLGPTKDDLTKEIGAEYFNKEMVLDQGSYALIESFFQNQGLQMADNNKKQAYVPAGAKVIPNDNGTAPGCIIEENGKILMMLPGPPNEAEPMFKNYCIPYLNGKTDHILVSKVIKICGIGESAVEEMLRDLIDAQGNPTIAPYAGTSQVELRITAAAVNHDEAYDLMKPVIAEIYKRMGDNIYGEDSSTLESTVVGYLAKKGLTIACAESCTGGLLTARLVDVPGASRVLSEGIVSYSNESKVRRLGVREDTLQRYGAVSRQTAEEMARGIAQNAGADIGISTTGVAGPDGGTGEKPVGLVYIGLFINGQAYAKELRMRGDRQKIRERAVTHALDFIRRQIGGNGNG